MGRMRRVAALGAQIACTGFLLGFAHSPSATAQERTCLERGFGFCSKTFHASATCSGQDQLARITGNKCASGNDCPLIEAWEPTPVLIVGVEVTMIEGAESLLYAYAGNGYHPNQMMFVGRGQTNRSQFFPKGLGFRLPSAGAPGYIDLHIACTKAQAQAFFTIYYERADKLADD